MIISTRPRILTVHYVVVFDDGVLKSIPIEWRRGLTVQDANAAASEKEHGVSFSSIGTGPNTFVTEIDGQANETNAYYWIFTVNGHVADVGCSQFVLKPNDIVRWESVPFDRSLARLECEGPQSIR